MDFMVADTRHREKTFKSKKKLSESRKRFWNPEKYFRVKKKKTFMKLRKKIKIEKNISESRKKFQNREKCFRIEKYFVTRVEKKSWIQWPRIQWTLFITQDKRRNKRNLLHCVNSTFKLYVTCKVIKYKVWKVWFVYYAFKETRNWYFCATPKSQAFFRPASVFLK